MRMGTCVLVYEYRASMYGYMCACIRVYIQCVWVHVCLYMSIQPVCMGTHVLVCNHTAKVTEAYSKWEPFSQRGHYARHPGRRKFTNEKVKG